MLRTANWRCTLNIVKQFQRATSSSSTQAVPTDDNQRIQTEQGPVEPSKPINKSTLVQSAFASLKRSAPSSLDDKIIAANDPESLLSLSQTTILSRKQALRVVTTLAEWSVSGQVDMSKYEKDARFVALCQMLGRAPQTVGSSHTKELAGDLSFVLGVTGDDEAAKLVSTISLPQMIKVLSSLGMKKRRSLPLLRSLSYHIVKSSIILDVKQGADILYSLASLNFPDEVLLDKVCLDMIKCVPKCRKSSVIASISTSLGQLRYKDPELLDVLADWIVKNREACRSQDVMSLLLTLATVYHNPTAGNDFFDIVTSHLDVENSPSALSWLNIVWSLAVFNRTNVDLLKTVLCTQFIDRIKASGAGVEPNAAPWKWKFLNLNAVAKFEEGYNEKLIDPSEIDYALYRSKDKLQLCASVLDAFSNLFPSSLYLRTNVDSSMGFFIDGECYIDAKMTPLAVVDKKTGQPLPPPKPGKAVRIALMVLDYHDHTKGKITMTGSSALNLYLLTKLGYRVMEIPYTEYNRKDKLTERVAYLQSRLKSLVLPNS